MNKNDIETVDFIIQSVLLQMVTVYEREEQPRQS